jgi:hypothetical protein
MNMQRLSRCDTSLLGVIYAEIQKALREDHVPLCLWRHSSDSIVWQIFMKFDIVLSKKKFSSMHELRENLSYDYHTLLEG